MKLRTLIIDDEPIALEKLRSYVDKVPFLKLAGACRNGLDASALIADEDIDVIFTDINMPDMNGLEFIGTLPVQPLVVFITAYANYAVDSYKLSAVDYLLKPYDFSAFQRAANKVLERYNLRACKNDRTISVPEPNDSGYSLFVKVDYRYVRVCPADIRYIKGYGEYLQIFLTGSDSPLLTLSSFNSIKSRLSSNFIQVHRSYIVNMDCVRSISKGRIIMDDTTYIPIGESYKDAFQAYLSTHSIGAGQKK